MERREFLRIGIISTILLAAGSTVEFAKPQEISYDGAYTFLKKVCGAVGSPLSVHCTPFVNLTEGMSRHRIRCTC